MSRMVLHDPLHHVPGVEIKRPFGIMMDVPLHEEMGQASQSRRHTRRYGYRSPPGSLRNESEADEQEQWDPVDAGSPDGIENAQETMPRGEERDTSGQRAE